MLPEDFEAWYLRSADGEMTPLSEVTNGRWEYGSPRLERFNGVPSRQIQGEPAPGYSTGEAMAEVERLIAQLPDGVAGAWSGLSYQERQAGAQAPLLYALSVLVVFLALAALYESWTIPISVMLAVPLGVLGAVLAAWCGASLMTSSSRLAFLLPLVSLPATPYFWWNSPEHSRIRE